MKAGRGNSRLAVCVVLAMLSSLVPVEGQGIGAVPRGTAREVALESPLFGSLLAQGIDKLEPASAVRASVVMRGSSRAVRSSSGSGRVRGVARVVVSGTTKRAGAQGPGLASRTKGQGSVPSSVSKGCVHSSQKECTKHCGQSGNTTFSQGSTPVAPSARVAGAGAVSGADSPMFGVALASAIDKLEPAQSPKVAKGGSSAWPAAKIYNCSPQPTYAGCGTCSGGNTCNGSSTCMPQTCQGTMTCNGPNTCNAIVTCGGSLTCGNSTTCNGSSSCNGGSTCNGASTCNRITCNSGGATCAGTSTCNGASSCGGYSTCDGTATCNGRVTCSGAATCLTQTCSGGSTCNNTSTCNHAATCGGSVSCGHSTTCDGTNTCDRMPTCDASSTCISVTCKSSGDTCQSGATCAGTGSTCGGNVTCQGTGTCGGGLTCNGSATCTGTTTCVGGSTCDGLVTCQGEPTCTTTCGANVTCQGGYTCKLSTTCSGTCAGTDTCAGTETCYSGCSGPTSAGSSTCGGGVTCGGDVCSSALAGSIIYPFSNLGIAEPALFLRDSLFGTGRSNEGKTIEHSPSIYKVVASAASYGDGITACSIMNGMTTPVDSALESDLTITASKPSIVTGGVQSSVHQCMITAYAPGMVGQTVEFSVVGHAGDSTQARLSDASKVIDSTGHAQTTLTSSNLDGTVTIKAICQGIEKTVAVLQEAAVYSTFYFDSTAFPADGESTASIVFCLVQNGNPDVVVPGHLICFKIDEIRDVDDNLVWKDDGQHGPCPSNYGAVSVSEAETSDGTGVAVGEFTAGTEPGIIYIRAEDNNDWTP